MCIRDRDYFAEHDEIGTDADARGPAMLAIEREVTESSDGEPGRFWRVRQTLADPADDHDWVIEAQVDLDATDAVGELVLTTLGLRQL